MEGEVEDSDDGVQREDKLTVLWEKCVQQTIFVDLSEDESLHLSDLESSSALHLSQEESVVSESSIHLSGSAELSALDVTSSEGSIINSPSEKEVQSISSQPHESAPKPNTTADDVPLKHEDSGQNTSDEDQDDLPYDGDLGTPFFNHTPSSEGSLSSDGRETIHASPEAHGLLGCSTTDRNVLDGSLVSAEPVPQTPASSSDTRQEDRFDASKPCDAASSCPADVNQLLLRHFSREELLRSGRLIEAETLPDVSLLESVDETVTSGASLHRSKRTNGDASGNLASYPESNQMFCSARTDEKRNTASQNVPLEREEDTTDITSRDAAKQGKTSEDDPVQRAHLVRTRSCSEMKYGQGQVHYPPPDFTKVAPKVKIPKVPSGAARPAPHGPSSMHRTQSSPGMLDLISKVLEDSIQPLEKPYVFDGNVKTPAALAPPFSDMTVCLSCDEDGLQSLPAAERSHLGSSGPHLPLAEHAGEKGAIAPRSSVKEVNTGSSGEPEEGSSDGEQMTAELGGIVIQFMQKVEEFRRCVSSVSLSTAEQQLMLRGIMEAQDQMERKYISKKEEHRALEMQNYMGLRRNTGTFDPNRIVEGYIFRTGMHIEDIKEMIDKNVCEQISPPHSSSTPTPMKETQDKKPSPLHLSPPSPPPSLHEGPIAGFSAVGFRTETWTDQEVVDDRENGLQESEELTTSDPLLKTTARLPRRTQGSLEELNIHTGEAEEERSSSEAGDHGDNVLDCLGGTRSSSRRRHWKPESCGTLESVLSRGGECYLGDSVSLGVDVSSSSEAPRGPDICAPTASSVLQSIVSPETDSGFGSSYLSQSVSEEFPPDQLTESMQHQNDVLSNSDSEDSHLQTAIHPASPTNRQWTGTHPSVQAQASDAAVQQWVESNSKKASVRLTESEGAAPALLHHHHASDAVLHAGRGPPYSCSCNSEAILALQSEVSKLKSVLEEGLVQLPQLAQKMDYLTSKYRQDRLERRSKARAQSHPKSTCSSLGKVSNNKQNICRPSSSQLRLDDWISSDLEPPNSNGFNEVDAGVEMLQFQQFPLGGRTAADFQYEPRWTAGSNRAAVVASFHAREKWSLFSPQRPLLQVGFASSSSLPASYKVREPPLQSTSHRRRRSTQSDTALLPSNVFFQRTASPISGPPRAYTRAGRHRGTEEEDASEALDQALEVARSMKRITAHMAKRLSADLVKAELHRKQLSMQPLGGRTHHGF